MARVLVTGSTTGLGRAAAQALLDGGHTVVLHARNAQRAADLGPLAERAAGVATGDLANHDETRALAEHANALGSLDAVIHNAGVYAEPERNPTADGHPRLLAVNLLAPYLLTALVRRPARLIYLSSDMHTAGRATLDDLNWTRRPWNGIQAYSDSKLYVTALAAAIARHWPDVRSNAVDPGWVPTRMGGPGAPDDLTLGHQTQVWLATSDDHAAAQTGKYWYHQRKRNPAATVNDPAFQDELLAELTRVTGVPLPNTADPFQMPEKTRATWPQ
jgi:NAD(P)-dependent dehydrogenase (short-subunit alcohol dehydrogenase family)